MTPIDFYILQATSPQSRETYACRLTDKAFKAGKKVFIYTESFADAQRLNTQLWTFKGEAFLPHDIYPDTNPSNVRIRIGYLPHQTHRNDSKKGGQVRTGGGFKYIEDVEQQPSSRDMS